MEDKIKKDCEDIKKQINNYLKNFEQSNFFDKKIDYFYKKIKEDISRGENK